MKARFINRMVSQPWHIAGPAGRTIISHMLRELLRAERPETDIDGNPLPKMRVAGDVAIIPVAGVIMLGVPDWVKDYGFNLTDPNDIEGEMSAAANDPGVAMIVLSIDSPGGESIGGEKLYDLVEAANRKKPVFAYAADGAQMCSSAYQAAAPCRAIFCGKFAEIGGIGTYLAYLDDSAYWENLGFKWETFRSGGLKGIDGKLTEAQREYLGRQVEEYGARFRAGVSRYRTGIDPENMQGQVFRGIDAAGRGFVAGIARDLDAAIGKCRKLIG